MDRVARRARGTVLLVQRYEGFARQKAREAVREVLRVEPEE